MLENGNNVISKYGYVFYKGYINSYRGLTFLEASRKLKKYYTNGPRKEILRYLVTKNVIPKP